METSLKVAPTEHSILKADATGTVPSKTSCLNQVAHVHRLRNSEENYDLHQYNLNMHILRNREGIAAPLKIGMELHAARQIGRMPFLQSSNIMEDALTGRDEMIGFSDFLSMPENNEYMRQPHVVVERSLGIH